LNSHIINYGLPEPKALAPEISQGPILAWGVILISVRPFCIDLLRTIIDRMLMR
jgi:hypothetical protein